MDLRYFDKAFTNESVNVKQQVARSIQSDYLGFTYNESPMMKKELGNLKYDAENELKEERNEESDE